MNEENQTLEWGRYDTYKIFQISDGSKEEDKEYVIVSPGKNILLGRYQGKYFDCFGANEEIAVIWDRNPKHVSETVKIYSKKDLELSDLMKIPEARKILKRQAELEDMIKKVGEEFRPDDHYFKK